MPVPARVLLFFPSLPLLTFPMKPRLAPLIFLLFITSCATQEICDSDNQSILVARFKSIATGESTDTIIPGLSVYGIREGSPDSLLYDSVSLGKIELPLDPGHPRSRYVLYTAQKNDTLVLEHASEAYLISYECGFAAQFYLKGFEYSGGMITDMEIISSSIDAEMETNEEHLWIYF
jgi:hypothetical protein